MAGPSGKPLTPKNGKVFGPYNTIAEADQGKSLAVKSKGKSDGLGAAAKAAVPNPLSGIDEIGAVLEAFFDTISDGKMWRSVGWLLLGLVLTVFGIRLWLGKSALPKPPSVVPVPV